MSTIKARTHMRVAQPKPRAKRLPHDAGHASLRECRVSSPACFGWHHHLIERGLVNPLGSSVPCRWWGVCYGKEHVAAGFASHFAGVRLFPIQAVEAIWVLGIVAVGSSLVLGGGAPGTALAWYVVMYGLGRFCLEFIRGDSDRPYLLGFSEAQWTSLLLMAAAAVAELAGFIPLHGWHVLAAAGVGLVMIGVTVRRRAGAAGLHRLLSAKHIGEVAQAVQLVESGEAGEGVAQRTGGAMGVRVSRTSLGVRISGGAIEDGRAGLTHYALSSGNGALTQDAAAVLAKLIMQLRHPGRAGRLLTGQRGVFHVLARPRDHQ